MQRGELVRSRRSARRCSERSSPARPRSTNGSRARGRTARPAGSGARRSLLAARRSAAAARARAVGGPEDQPRGICCSSSSGRSLCAFSAQVVGLEDRPPRREADEHGEQHADEREEAGDLRGSRGHPPAVPRRPAAGAVGDDQEQREQDEVRHDRATAVGDERQRYARQRDHPVTPPTITKTCSAKHRGQAGGEQLREAVAARASRS